mmetsp:Transcript_50491/g.107549  ORF Transcript_50491/g.107549 Transcript_50491/m.107549 type:complete len:107 (+) Transcript_50491:1426-1746(+)
MQICFLEIVSIPYCFPPPNEVQAPVESVFRFLFRFQPSATSTGNFMLLGSWPAMVKLKARVCLKAIAHSSVDIWTRYLGEGKGVRMRWLLMPRLDKMKTRWRKVCR